MKLIEPQAMIQDGLETKRPSELVGQIISNSSFVQSKASQTHL